MSDIPTAVNNMDSASDIAQWLINKRIGPTAEKEVRHSVMLLVEELKKRREDLESFINTIATDGIQPGKCLILPPLYGCKEFRHVVYAKIWRWPNVTKSQLKRLEFCLQYNTYRVCVNPYHYELVDTVKPIPNTEFYKQKHKLVIDIIPLQKQVELINMFKMTNNIMLLEKKTGVNPLHIKCILNRKDEVVDLYYNRLYFVSDEDMDGADIILMEWIKYYTKYLKGSPSFRVVIKAAKYLNDLLNMPTYYIRRETWRKINAMLENGRELSPYSFNLDMYTILKTCGELILKPEIYKKFMNTVERTTFIRIKYSKRDTNETNKALWTDFMDDNSEQDNNEVIRERSESPHLTIVEKEPVEPINVDIDEVKKCTTEENLSKDFPPLLTFVPQTVNKIKVRDDLISPKDTSAVHNGKEKGKAEIFKDLIEVKPELEKTEKNKTKQTVDVHTHFKEYREMEVGQCLLGNGNHCESKSVKIAEEPIYVAHSALPSFKDDYHAYEKEHTCEEFLNNPDVQNANNDDDKDDSDDEEDDIQIVFEIEDEDENIVKNELLKIITQYTQDKESKQKSTNANDIAKKETNRNNIAEIINLDISPEFVYNDSYAATTQTTADIQKRSRTEDHSSNMFLQPKKILHLEEAFL